MSDWAYISDEIKPHEGFMENMKSCLYAAEKHGIVFGQAIEDRQSLIMAAQRYLPPYSIAKCVNTECAMIKQSVIDLFGQPDTATRSLLEALEEYRSKIGGFGFSAVNAHHALYSYKNKEYEITAAVNSAAADEYGTGTLFRFLPVLDEEYYPKKRILFECINLPCTYNGTAETMLSEFEAFCRLYESKYDIYMLTSREAAAYYKLEEKHSGIIYPDTLSGVFHLGFSPVQAMWYEPQLLLNKHCLKIVQQILDIIIVRSCGQTDNNVERSIGLSTKICDAMTFISSTGRDDFMAYYKNRSETAGTDKESRVVYVAKDITEKVSDEQELPFDKYFLIAGGSFKHKAINEAIEAVSRVTQHNFIVIGVQENGHIQSNIFGYQSGGLDESFVNLLYARSRAVIFPSLYEGFGLPVVMGLKNNKCVIVYDNAVNRELQKRFPQYNKNFLFFSKFGQIPEIIGSTDFAGFDTNADAAYNDSWDRAARELEALFSGIIKAEPDMDRLRERAFIFGQIEARTADVLSRREREDDSALKMLLRQFGDYKLFRLLRFAIKENIKQRHPKIYNLFRS